MTMVKPISEYTNRDNREPNGRERRSVLREHMVYVVQQDGSDRIKVGRTQNASIRIHQYESASGVPVRYLMQIIVETREASKQLEAHMVSSLAKRFPKFKREWFNLDGASVYEAVSDALAKFGVPVTAVRGMPGSERNPMGSHDVDAGEARRLLCGQGRRGKRFGLAI